MRARLPSLHALHCFDVAAREGTFTAAAREMHLTPGAVSRQIRALESELGARLFVRGGRNVALSPDGRALRLTTERAFGELRAGLAALRRRSGSPLVLSCEPTLTLEWLLPRLSQLRELHPELLVRLEATGGPVDFAATGVDVAVRRRDFPVAAGVACDVLMDEWVGPVCSPAYANDPRNDQRVTLLHTRTRPTAFRDWSLAASRTLSARDELTFDHFALSLQAAVAGAGLAVGPYPLVAEAVRAGRLVAPFGFLRGDVGYVVLAPLAEVEAPGVQALRQWLTSQASGMRPSRSLRRARARPARDRRSP